MTSWKIATKKQYNTCIQEWNKFSIQRQVDPVSPSVKDVRSFVCVHKRFRIQCHQHARSAFSKSIKFNDRPVGQHPVIVRF